MEYSSATIVIISLGGCIITLIISFFLGKAMAPKVGQDVPDIPK